MMRSVPCNWIHNVRPYPPLHGPKHPTCQGYCVLAGITPLSSSQDTPTLPATRRSCFLPSRLAGLGALPNTLCSLHLGAKLWLSLPHNQSYVPHTRICGVFLQTGRLSPHFLAL